MTTPIITIDATGPSAPTYADVLAWVQDQYKIIYGADIVLDPSTQDGQLLAIFADGINDMNNAAIAAFNSFRPGFAFGAGLSSIVKINGIRRKVPSNSRCGVTLVGQDGTEISNVTIQDQYTGIQWFIQGPVTIPPEGFVNTVALSLKQGAVTAAAGALTDIITPVPGWQTVTNVNPAVPGAPVETDAQLRRRQQQSTAIPAQTVLESIQGNLLALPSVTRAKVWENDTGAYDANGIPPRSIACVVKGVDMVGIAQTIQRTKTPGVPTWGDIGLTMFDRYGVPSHINWFQLVEETITVLIHATASYGYTDTIGGYIKASLVDYMQSRDIGQSIYLGDVYSPANLDGDNALAATNLTQPQLDPLGATYKIDAPFGIALARSDMAANGNYPSGSTGIGVFDSSYYQVGETIWIQLEDFTYYRTVITAILSNIWIIVLDPVPSQRSVVNGALIFAVGDVMIRFKEAAVATTGSIILNVR